MAEGDIVKPGKETTEFWGKIAVQAILLAISAGWIKPEMVETAGPWIQMVAVLAAAVLEGVYGVSRGIAKAGSGPPPPPTE